MYKEMEITVERGAGGALLRLAGELDAPACPQVARAVAREVEAGIRHIVLDLAHVRFLGSNGIEAIFCAARTLARAGGEVALARPSAFCRGILECVGLDRVVEIHGSLEGALSRWRPRQPEADGGAARLRFGH